MAVTLAVALPDRERVDSSVCAPAPGAKQSATNPSRAIHFFMRFSNRVLGPASIQNLTILNESSRRNKNTSENFFVLFLSCRAFRDQATTDNSALSSATLSKAKYISSIMRVEKAAADRWLW